MWDLITKSVLGIIDKTIPDPKQRDAAKLELLKQAQDGEIDKVNAQLSAIIADSKSADPWTSRARPMFLYVFYLFILASIPMGIIYSLDPNRAAQIALGMQAWFEALPDEIYYLFGVGYLGYTGARSYDKKQLVLGTKNK